MRHSVFRMSVYAGAAIICLPSDHRPGRAAAVEQIAVHDNRIAAGTLERGVLTIRLEAREGEWHPDGDAEPGLKMMAFGVEGGPLQIPGPLIRVIVGTEIRAFVRNSIAGQTITLHGFNDHGVTRAGDDTVSIAPGEQREIRFTVRTAGTYYYWAGFPAGTAMGRRLGRDSQLSGAFIVDSRSEPRRPDRTFVIGLWSEPVRVDTSTVNVGRIVINGKSWPHTERLAYGLGDTVRIRVINTGAGVHPMHLHGFYFRVDSRGSGQVDTLFDSKASPRMANTERLAVGRTFSMTWVPTRAGNWLFHCHDPVHVDRDRALDGRPRPAPDPSHGGMNHIEDMMSGPVMGITVREVGGARPAAAPAARRRLRLVARVDTGGTAAEPSFGYTLNGGRTPSLPGPTILLKRGEPVAITIVNTLREPTTVHWHGIELDSYFDGVAGFAGHPGRLAPPIAASDSFVARFTPPRSGTFIYHPHVAEVRQQQAGLSGALIVVDDPAKFDSTTDLVMLITVPRLIRDGAVVLVNGSMTPAPRELHSGTRYRLRFINLHNYRAAMIMKIVRDSTVLSWRSIAKDGLDLPADQATIRPSQVQMGNGETYDFEFIAPEAGDLRLDVTTGAGILLTTMKLRVR